MNKNRQVILSYFKRFVNKETIYYLFFGVLTTGVNIITYTIFSSFHIVYWLSNIFAWVMSIIFAFTTNKLYVFKSRDIHFSVLLKEAVSFLLTRLFSGACDLGFMIFAVQVLYMNDFIAKILTNVFVVVINYICSKTIVFKTHCEVNEN